MTELLKLTQGNAKNKLEQIVEYINGLVSGGIGGGGGGAKESAGYIGEYNFRGWNLPPFADVSEGDIIYTDSDILSNGTLYLTKKSLDGYDNTATLLGLAHGWPDASILLMAPIDEPIHRYNIVRVRSTGNSTYNNASLGDDLIGLSLDNTYGNSSRGDDVLAENRRFKLYFFSGGTDVMGTPE